MSSWLDVVPEVNTVLVAVAGILIILGWREIRTKRRIHVHRRLMVSATTVFALFLVLYAIRLVIEGPTEFVQQNPAAPSWAAPVYYVFLGTHMALALVTVVIIPIVMRYAIKGEFAKHRPLARRLVPMWLVSIAMGITVYFMLFVVWS